ncbi:chorismate-binding protein [Candidatus Pelagibacter sp. HIMB1321]|uniref:chorismate-binding protein n=1 Tax=Candidatus Pelagibacter sp. HIMB1321 TaxID=1388755 RepID=UPI000A080330|nr:chorismate-binding protein [Candidatus Pelagibacter sp. HIMB1321]SMF73794.1 para-aminobenzoate synthetase component 1 [Candidatus Pelagibacter sp. HIMB1321]
MSNIYKLYKLHNSNQPYIIYKSNKGFKIYYDFSKKIILRNIKDVQNFLNFKTNKKKSKSTDLFLGFFGYELLNNLIDIKIPKQKSLNFYKGIFYKPETVLSINNFVNSNNYKKLNKNFKININKKAYSKIFDKFKKRIRAGDTYQIKICTKYKSKSKVDPLDFFSRLSEFNLAPEAFMIKDKDFSIVSCSPENLIDKKGNQISTKPIAGTVKKINKMNKSKALKYFQKNIKENKEHNMIVDMERNDLSKICVPLSVEVVKEKVIEEYRDLFHYVSLIKGKVRKSVQILDIIKAMMPGGSVIGCPKINTLKLLNNQEKENRNIYTGSFGYIKFNGDMRFNIIIRSILNFKNISEVAVASGVVIDSNASREFNENYIKAKALIDLY